MSTLHLLILALIQGLTEFLPISSSAHLILPAKILGWQDQGPLIDVMAHFGSLFAVMAYFRKDVAAILAGCIDLLHRRLNVDSVLALNLIIATPPALCLGAFLHFGGFDESLRDVRVIAFTTIMFGVLLWISDVVGKQEKTTSDLTWKSAALLGFAQSIALIPGTSRSGITMTTGRFMGLTRVEAARFSMLMSIPIIGAGGLFSLIKLASSPGNSGGLADGLMVAVMSFAAAYASIAFFMKLVGRIGMFPFMIYRLILGAGLIYWMIAGGGG